MITNEDFLNGSVKQGLKCYSSNLFLTGRVYYNRKKKVFSMVQKGCLTFCFDCNSYFFVNDGETLPF